MTREFRISAEDDGIRLDRWFRRNMPEASYNQVSRWARTGQLRLDGARVQPGDHLQEGQTLRIPPVEPVAALATPKAPRQLSPEEVEFARSLVIYSDEDAIVINKPPGLATQGGTKTTVHVDGLLDALRFENDRRPHLVHRLDKDTSGVLLLARGPRAAAFFGKCFASRQTRKIYWAVTVGTPPEADFVIDLPLAKQPGTGGEKMHVDRKNGLPARTRLRLIDRAVKKAAFVELQPFTGRTHQLRAHMTAIGTPIAGDGKYGAKEAFLTGGISRKLHLHARRLVIDLPSGGKLDIKADLPVHFLDTLGMLGFDPETADLPDVPLPATGAAPMHRPATGKRKGPVKGSHGQRGRARGQKGKRR